MPAIKKISKEAIIDAAVDVLREGGAAAINARSEAKKLGCSTQPIYLSFQNMDDLKAAMTQRTVALHTRHVRNSNSDTQYSCYGMGFVKFAAEERHLFRWLYLDGGAVRPLSGWRAAAGDHRGHGERIRIHRGGRTETASGYDVLFLRNGDFGQYRASQFNGCGAAGSVSQRVYGADGISGPAGVLSQNYGNCHMGGFGGGNAFHCSRRRKEEKAI